MRPFQKTKYLIITFLISILFMLGCKKSSNDPDTDPLNIPDPTFIESYNPEFNEAQGTTHTGNFFPVFEGKENHYQGIMSGNMTMILNGYSIPTEIASNGCVAYSKILPQIAVNLNGAPYNLFPEEQYSFVGMDSAVTDTCRYYQVTGDEVLIRAIHGPNGLLEVEDPVFMKSELIVGDSWMSQPTVNTSSYVSDSDAEMDITITCKMIVTGKKNIDIQIGGQDTTVESIQVDQVAEINGNISMSDYATKMKISGKIISLLFMVDGIGIGATNDDVKIEISGTFSNGSTTSNLKISISILDELYLSDYINPTKINSVNSGFDFSGQDIPVNINKIVSKILSSVKNNRF